MNSIRRFPYRTPSFGRLELTQWHWVTNGTNQSLPRFITAWDPATSLELVATAHVDTVGIGRDCGLGIGAKLRLVSVWHSTGSGLSGHGDMLTLDIDSAIQTYHLHIVIPGTLIAQRVQIGIQIVLIHPGSEPEAFAPTQIGCQLDSKTQILHLEGDGARFPVEMIDFSSTIFDAKAAWALQWDEMEWDQSFLGNVRLYINIANKRVSEAVSHPRQTNDGIWEVIRYEVCRTMIERALESDDFVSNAYLFQPGSVGAVVVDLIKRYFPSLSIEACREQMRHRAVFESHLQAALHLFGEK